MSKTGGLYMDALHKSDQIILELLDAMLAISNLWHNSNSESDTGLEMVKIADAMLDKHIP